MFRVGGYRIGVPQGSAIGPLLFFLYINDLEQNIESCIKFFAEETMLYSIILAERISAADLSHDLGINQDWSYHWKMDFNPDPNKQAVEIIFSQKKIKPVHPPLFFNDVEVKKVDSHKHLGLTPDPKLMKISQKLERVLELLGIFHLSPLLRPLMKFTNYSRDLTLITVMSFTTFRL